MINLRDLKIEFFKSSGPGGQHKNKRFTAVRVRHLPTGLSAVATEQRSQTQNREIAIQRITEKVARFTKKKKKRIPVTMSKAVKERILEAKRRRSQKKQLRAEVKEDAW